VKVIESACSLTFEQAVNFRNENWKEYSIGCILCGNLCKYIEQFNLPSQNDVKNHDGTLKKWLKPE